MVQNYSTVTDCFRFDVLSDNNFGKNIDYNLDLSFKLIIRSSKLTKFQYQKKPGARTDDRI